MRIIKSKILEMYDIYEESIMNNYIKIFELDNDKSRMITIQLKNWKKLTREENYYVQRFN